MSVKMMGRVWAHSQSEGGELLVMLALADFANDQGESCYPSVPILAQKARLTERQTFRVLKRLEEAGEIRRERSNGGRSHRSQYFITVSENPDKITVTNFHCKNNSDICDTKTMTSALGELKEKERIKEKEKNRHRTVNKERETESHKPIPDLSSTSRKKKTREASIPLEFQPTISKVIARMNELSGARFQDNTPGTLRGLIARLRAGASEPDCLAVVEHQWRAWGSNQEMIEHFDPATLFRERNFPRYLAKAQRLSTNGAGSGRRELEELTI